MSAYVGYNQTKLRVRVKMSPKGPTEALTTTHNHNFTAPTSEGGTRDPERNIQYKKAQSGPRFEPATLNL